MWDISGISALNRAGQVAFRVPPNGKISSLLSWLDLAHFTVTKRKIQFNRYDGLETHPCFRQYKFFPKGKFIRQ
jgi:hypothetical protein